jgi:hypothetical protein
VTGGTTNVDLVLTPKGTGAVIVGPEPDGTLTGGDKRGIDATDLQRVRYYSANAVASGTTSFIGGGHSNRAYGNLSSVGGGDRNSANTSSCVGGGSENSASSAFATIPGGLNNTASGWASFAHGQNAISNLSHMWAFGGGGGSQAVLHLMERSTTDATPVELQLGTYSERRVIASNSVLSVTVNIIGTKSDGSAIARYLRQVTIKNVSGTTSLVGSVITLGTDEAAGTSISITADDTNDAIKIEVTGIAAETWKWSALLQGISRTL